MMFPCTTSKEDLEELLIQPESPREGTFPCRDDRHIEKIVGYHPKSYALTLRFEDGTVIRYTVEEFLNKGPVFERLRDPAEFMKAEIIYGGAALVWPHSEDKTKDIDFAAGTVYHRGEVICE